MQAYPTLFLAADSTTSTWGSLTPENAGTTVTATNTFEYTASGDTSPTSVDGTISWATAWVTANAAEDATVTYQLYQAAEMLFPNTDTETYQLDTWVFIPSTIPAEAPANAEGDDQWTVFQNTYTQDSTTDTSGTEDVTTYTNTILMTVQLAEGPAPTTIAEAADIIAVVTDMSDSPQVTQEMTFTTGDTAPKKKNASQAATILSFTAADTVVTTDGTTAANLAGQYDFVADQTYVTLAVNTDVTV